MSDINYFVLTAVDCDADYRPTLLPMVGTLAEELKEKAGLRLFDMDLLQPETILGQLYCFRLMQT